jgi:polar amino acid transport system permease protein
MQSSSLTNIVTSRLGSIRYGHGEIPWYRRLEFTFGTLAVLLLVAFFLPRPVVPTALTWLAVGIFYLLALAWVGLLLGDVLKPEWAKVAAAFGVLILGGLLFYRYADAEWARLGHVFFNWELMSTPMEGGATGWSILLDGLWVTVQLAFFAIVFSTVLGLLLAVFRTFDNVILNFFIVAYIDFFRSMPIIVLMVLIYYALPYTGITLSPMVSGILALSLNASAYVSEIFRAGILSVSHGQIEAARALGLTPLQTMRLVILPQAFRVVLPPLASNYVAGAKDTAICSAITILELLKAGMQVQAFYANPTALIVATGMYLVILVPLTRLTGLLEAKMRGRKARAR